jgi:hypothetical protein
MKRMELPNASKAGWQKLRFGQDVISPLHVPQTGLGGDAEARGGAVWRAQGGFEEDQPMARLINY